MNVLFLKDKNNRWLCTLNKLTFESKEEAIKFIEGLNGEVVVEGKDFFRARIKNG